MPRTLFIFFDTLLTAVNFVVLMLSSIDTLYIPVMVGGLAFGANWALVPTVISELFGARAFASNYNFVQVGVQSSEHHRTRSNANTLRSEK